MGTAVKVGAGVAVVSALALGTYLLYGKNGAKNRKAVKAWMLKAKGEILEKLESVKDMGVDSYHDLVDSVITKYSAKTDMTKADISALVKELKSYGSQFVKKTASKKKTKKSVKKTTRSTSSVQAKKAKK